MTTQVDVESKIRDAVIASADFNWSEDWQEPELLDRVTGEPRFPVVTARAAGFQPDAGRFREVWEIRVIFGQARAQLTSLGIMSLLRSLVYDVLEETGCYPRLRPAPISYTTKLGRGAKEYVTGTVILLG